jgi:hypothetical protein
LVFGLTPRGNEIKVEGAGTAQLGQHVPFTVNTNTSGSGLVRCHVYSPSGTRLDIYSTNVLLQNGASSFVVPFALNDEPGKYVIQATDVLTGARFEKTIDVK